MSHDPPPDLATVLQTLAALAPPETRGSSGPPPSQRTPNPPTPVVDPATILEWPAGLRCAMKTVATDEQALKQIRQMIQSQHDHEKQWWDGREALVQRQAARVEGQKRLEEMLRAVGSTAPSGSSGTSPQEVADELKTYDLKVHRAQAAMIQEMSQRLQRLGVPFFGVPTAMIVKTDTASQPRRTISERNLVMLQRKMLCFLEDLCGEDSP